MINEILIFPGESGDGGAPTVVTKDEKAAVERAHAHAVKQWRARKRMCACVTDAILESYGKPRKTFYEEVGVETDEEHGVAIPDI